MADELKNTNNDEINAALQEFEAKATPAEVQNAQASTPATKEVEGISFQNESYAGIKFYKETGTPKIIKFVMKASGGSIKEQKHAEYLLFFIVVLMLLASVYFFFFWGSTSTAKLTPEQIEANKTMVDRMNSVKGTVK